MVIPTSCGPGPPQNSFRRYSKSNSDKSLHNNKDKGIFPWRQATRGHITVNSIKTKWYWSFQSIVKCVFAISMLFIVSTGDGVRAEKSKHYYMQSVCKNHFLQQLYRKIDGGVLWSQNERNLDCVITFQTHSILQRFMLRFDTLQLDCNDHLYVYDGAHAVGNHKADLSCRNTKQTVGAIFTRTNFVTLKYITDGWGTDTNGFKLVITAVKDPKHACKDFRCSKEFCIHEDLVCDGVNHCGDGSDEAKSLLCENQNTSTLLGLETTWFILIAVSVTLVFTACIVGVSICIRRRNATIAANQNAYQLRQTSAEANGSSKYLHDPLAREHTTLPSSSGNWLHPAGPKGYHRIQLKLKMATKVRPTWCLANLDH